MIILHTLKAWQILFGGTILTLALWLKRKGCSVSNIIKACGTKVVFIVSLYTLHEK